MMARACLFRRLFSMASLGIALASLGAGMAQAQSQQASGPLPSYEVATIKPGGPSSGFVPGGPRNIAHMAYPSARSLVALAYNFPPGGGARVVGGPSWIDNEPYNIEAKIPDDEMARMQTMTLEQRQAESRMMQQTLLADRFKLKAHLETREMPIYELVVAKGGPKLKEVAAFVPPPPPQPGAQAAGPRPPGLPGPGGPMPAMTHGIRTLRKDGGIEMTVMSMTLDAVAGGSSLGLNDRPVVNKTGLTGAYDFTLTWTPSPGSMPGPPGMPQPPSAQSDSSGPSLFTAVEEQLGLKLVPSKGPVEVLVIDSIERPSEN